MDINRRIHPYLDDLLTKGLRTEEPIDPVLHNCAFKLNLEKRNELITVELNFSVGIVYYNNEEICRVSWVNDGVSFKVIKGCYSLVEMMGAVLNTLQELREIH